MKNLIEDIKGLMVGALVWLLILCIVTIVITLILAGVAFIAAIPGSTLLLIYLVLKTNP